MHFPDVLDDFSFLDRHCISKTRKANLLRSRCKKAQFFGVSVGVSKVSVFVMSSWGGSVLGISGDVGRFPKVFRGLGVFRRAWGLLEYF